MIGGIVLCAGYGTRLRPITDEVPKPAIPFLGKPMVWYALRALKISGVTQIAVNLCHLPDAMSQAVCACCRDLGLEGVAFSREVGEIRGTGGGAAACARLLPSCDRFIIYHGDVLSGGDLAHALESHVRSGALVSMVVSPRWEGCRLGMIETCAGDVVRIRDWCSPRVHQKSDSVCEPRCFTGIHIVEREVLESIPESGYTCLVTEIYRRMLEAGERIHACEDASFFADVGTPETYLAAQRRILEKPDLLPGVEVVFRSRVESSEILDPVFGDETCTCRYSRVGPNVCLSQGATILHENVANCMAFGRWRLSADGA